MRTPIHDDRPVGPPPAPRPHRRSRANMPRCDRGLGAHRRAPPMKPLLLALLAGLVGGTAGGFAVHWAARSAGVSPAPAGDAAALREVKDAIAALERRLERPGLATAAATDAPAPAPAP